MSAWLSRAALRLGRPGGPATAAPFCLGSLRAPRCCRRLATLRGGSEGLRLPPASSSPASGLAPPGRPRALGTHPKKEPIEALNTAQGARDFIYSLHSTERSCLLRELHRFESIAIAQASRYPKPLVPFEKATKRVTSPESTSTFEKLEVAPPSPGQLKHVFFHNAIPFVGFGFLDNAIMIAAGTQIELSIGVVLGITTMAAAALGNLVSDLAGLGNKAAFFFELLHLWLPVMVFMCPSTGVLNIFSSSAQEGVALYALIPQVHKGHSDPNCHPVPSNCLSQRVRTTMGVSTLQRKKQRATSLTF
ncbi:transmembrane protein 65 isoform X1 [Chelonia mydas]|uniref:transmembrane protein 65 isoform X1 n=1 Tax=Chelonia mydas TaxID=8469 RepID=UPI0018A1C694|nr:transmembrane protein 65 isoform X1 [Chelonia mydas]